MRFFFICPDIDQPTGGIKQIYRQVDILNDYGFDAAILHNDPTFKCTWFVNSTLVVHSKEVFEEINKYSKKPKPSIYELRGIMGFVKKSKSSYRSIQKSKTKKVIIEDNDILIFPEVLAFANSKIYPKNRKVIYNQNCYYTFQNQQDLIDSPYLRENNFATIVASFDAINYLTYAFPGINLHRVHYGIDYRVFSYQPNKEKQIAYMPRKLKEDVVQVISIIKQLDIAKGWEFVEIDNMNENEVATALKRSAIFLSFNHREGFGMPPAEAMACGCIVIGYTGKGGKEYFDETFSYPIPDRDILKFTKTLEQVLIEYDLDTKQFSQKGKKASEFILSEYAIEVEKNDIINVWKEILK